MMLVEIEATTSAYYFFAEALAIIMASFSMDEEVRLHTSNASREKYNLLATLFGIVTALDYLERAYVRDSITAVECVAIPLSLFGPRWS